MNRKVIIAIAAALLFTAGYFAIAARNAPAVVPQNTDTHAPDTRAYDNSQYGIGFDYPAKLVLTETRAEGAYAIGLVKPEDTKLPANGEGPMSLTVTVFPNTRKLALEEWLRTDTQSNLRGGDGKLTTTTVAGSPALSYTWSGLYEGETTTFLHGSDVIAVTVDRDKPGDMLEEAYRAVLGSFRLR